VVPSEVTSEKSQMRDPLSIPLRKRQIYLRDFLELSRALLAHSRIRP
jgi:hypothetical protein